MCIVDLGLKLVCKLALVSPEGCCMEGGGRNKKKTGRKRRMNLTHALDVKIGHKKPVQI